MRDGQKLSVAKKLRREMTDAETRLWRNLRAKRFSGVKFRRQVPIGPYIADFACFEHRLVIEVDGSQHADSAGDAARDRRLAELGWRVLRFWNSDLSQNPEGVLVAIAHAVGKV